MSLAAQDRELLTNSRFTGERKTKATLTPGLIHARSVNGVTLIGVQGENFFLFGFGTSWQFKVNGGTVDAKHSKHKQRDDRTSDSVSLHHRHTLCHEQSGMTQHELLFLRTFVAK